MRLNPFIIFPTFLLALFPLFVVSQPLFPIKKDKKWGLMDVDGRIVKQPVYDAIGEFKDFGYAVMQRNGKIGLLNDQGLEVVPPKFEDLKALDSSLVSVMEGAVWKVINLEGRVILQPGYDRVEILKSGIDRKKVFLAFQKEKKWGLVNHQGKLICRPKYDRIALLATNAQAGQVGSLFQIGVEDKIGLMQESGVELLPPVADEVEVYAANLIFFKKNRLWGAVDLKGKPVLDAVYEHFSRLSENFVKLTHNNQPQLLSLVYNRIVSFDAFEAFYPFSEEYVLCKKQRLIGLLDHCGELVLTGRYNEIQAYEGDFFRANLDGKWGIVTLGDRVVIPFDYQYISPMKNNLCVVIQDRKVGIANALGKVVVSPGFDKIDIQEYSAKAVLDGKLTVFDFNESGELLDENSFSKHFTIRVLQDRQLALPETTADSPYQLDKFEWFYSPRHDRWGLRRLDNGSVKIEPTFHEVQVQKALGLTLVGIEAKQPVVFDRTAYRYEMAYGIVQNDTGLLVHEVDLVDVRLADFEKGLPAARCIFTSGKHGLVNRIGKIICKDYAYIGDFQHGMAKMSPKGKLTVVLPKSKNENLLGDFQQFLTAQLSAYTLTDYTQLDLDLDNHGVLACEGCNWGYMDTLGQQAVIPQFSFARDFVNNVGIVSQDGKWGMVDKKGKMLIPCRYDELGFLEKTGNQVLRIFKKEEKYGLIDTLGQLMVGVQYDEIGNFSDGRLAVKRNRLWGFVDKHGREVVPCRFDEVGPFSEGLAAARLGSKWGFIDKNGGVEIDFLFSKAGNFSNGLSPAKKEGPHYGYIDPTGKWAIEPRFSKASNFDRGVARVGELVGQTLRTGLIDAKGYYKVKPKYLSVSEFDRHGLAVAEHPGSTVKYGLINLKGDQVGAAQFRGIEPFREGLARFHHEDGMGFLDTLGKVVIEPKFQKASDFSEGKAAVWIDGRCGFIGKSGEFVVSPQFTKCMDFKGGKAIVYEKNQRVGLIDTLGNFIIEPGSERLIDFSDGRGLVRNGRYQFYYITEQAKFYDGYYEKAGQFQHGVAVVQVEGKWAIINQQGIEIIPPKYDKIEQFENGFAKVRIKGFNGLTNLQGELIVQPDYEYISYAGEGLFRVEQGDKVGYFDLDGKWVWGLQD